MHEIELVVAVVAAVLLNRFLIMRKKYQALFILKSSSTFTLQKQSRHHGHRQ
jgi:hypothetical protein